MLTTPDNLLFFHLLDDGLQDTSMYSHEDDKKWQVTLMATWMN